MTNLKRAQSASTSLLQRANDLDVWLYSAIAGTTTPWLDEPIQRLSTAANTPDCPWRPQPCSPSSAALAAIRRQ